MKRKCCRLYGAVLCLLLGLVLLAVPAAAEPAPGSATFVIAIEGDIDQGLVHYVSRAYADAITQGAGAVIFEVDTYGGLVDSAIQLKDLIMSAQVPTVCFVDHKAISAGSLIALSGEKLVMRPGTTIGAAEPRVGSEKADEKAVSMWTTQLSAVAQARGKDGQVAAAMADSDIAIPGVVERGKLLTLGDQQALELGIADAVLENRQQVVAEFNLPPDIRVVEATFQENVVQWLSSPFIASILLTLGIAGLVLELITPGFGIFGAIGILAFVAFFAGNMWAGYAGVGSVLLFLAGAFLIVMEIFVIPGFGVPGILGIASLLASVIFASPSVQYGAVALLIALVASIALIAFVAKNKKTRRVWKRFILAQRQENQEGYTSQAQDQETLLGAIGKAATPLRPAGAALFGERRVDVVTQGEFIEREATVEVIEVSSSRVVVREKKVELTKE